MGHDFACAPGIDQETSPRAQVGDACDSHSCLVIGGDEKNCLDPKTTLHCYSPMVQLDAGQARRLPLFINRTSVGARYSWLVQHRPRRAVRRAR
jgi:hypothetical protein